MKKQQAIRIAMTVLTLAACAAVCWSVLALYADGLARRAASASSAEPIFTRALVGAQLRRVAPLLVLWLAGAAAAGLAGGALPPRGKSAQDSGRMLELLRAYAAELPPEALREETLRRRVRLALGAATALCAAWALAWLLNGNNFTSWDLEAVMGALLAHVLPPVGAAFAALLAGAHWQERSVRREIAALRRVPRAKERRAAPMRGPRETPARTAVRLVLVGGAAALVVLGVRNGGLNDVLVKAINICTECIGLG